MVDSDKPKNENIPQQRENKIKPKLINKDKHQNDCIHQNMKNN
jgi:hypothetical protein